MNIENILPVSSTFQSQYLHINRLGQEHIKDKKIVILGLVRNLESKLQNNINKLLELVNIAANYKIILFENDSIDDTKNILKELSKKNSNIISLHETLNRQQYGPVKDKNRTLALAEYRNKLLDIVKKEFFDYDYVIVCDMDFVDFSMHGCYNSFGWLSQYTHIDAIAGNSFQLKSTPDNRLCLWNYDSWAFRQNCWNQLYYNNEYITYDPTSWFGIWLPPVGSSIMLVNSAFGGMTIYRLSKFINGNYSGDDCEHVTLHYSLSHNNQSFQLYLNPSQIMLVE